MNKPTDEQILQWTAALRSGKYKQTKSNLQDENGYCCLGVACDLFIPQFQIETDSKLRIKGAMPGDQGHAPLWLKVINSDFCGFTAIGLASLNDGGVSGGPEKIALSPFTFDEIADVLEAVYVLKVLDKNNV